jgi:hypothetical protein
MNKVNDIYFIKEINGPGVMWPLTRVIRLGGVGLY